MVKYINHELVNDIELISVDCVRTPIHTAENKASLQVIDSHQARNTSNLQNKIQQLSKAMDVIGSPYSKRRD